ncbi:MAG: type II secretion system F family protein [Gemmataceae bacterium]|nr:type II secretion system F family protein [Gemmataceae bacterium]
MHDQLLLMTGLTTAASLGSAAWQVIGPERLPAGLTDSERRRRTALADESFVFRWMGEPARWLAALAPRVASPAAFTRLSHDLELLEIRHWRGDEFAAVKSLEAIPVVGMIALLVGYFAGPTVTAIAIGLGIVAVPFVLMHDLRSRAGTYVANVRLRLPYVLDLMTLVLEAGAGTLPACLERAAEECEDHPLGLELQRVLTGLKQGASQADMLREMDRRLADPDVRELVSTLTTAEERGIPLKEALRSQADRMRRREVQWLEKSAEEAKVHITWPALLVMVACLLIIAAPWVIILVV